MDNKIRSIFEQKIRQEVTESKTKRCLRNLLSILSDDELLISFPPKKRCATYCDGLKGYNCRSFIPALEMLGFINRTDYIDRLEEYGVQA